MDYPVQNAAFLWVIVLNALSVAFDPICAELALHKHTLIDFIWHAPWSLLYIILSSGVLLLH